MELHPNTGFNQRRLGDAGSRQLLCTKGFVADNKWAGVA